MFEQYFAIKKEYPDVLLFYRMGDFYELFFEDAKIAAKELQIALTCRNSNAEHPIPMCGVPHHSAEVYLNQLLAKNYKVAICEQVEDPKTAKGLVKRAVTLVRTPGTAVEDASLSAKTNNYLGALYWNEKKQAGGFAWLEYSTGTWSGLQSSKQAELLQWVQKISPKELLLPDLSPEDMPIPQVFNLKNYGSMRLPARAYFDLKTSTERILKAQGIQELGAVNLLDKEELTRACGALLAYLKQTQKQEQAHLTPFKPLLLGQHLIIDEITERNLEIFKTLDGKKGSGTLWDVLDETITPMGGRLLEERLKHPWRNIERIEETADSVNFFYEQEHKRNALRQALDDVYDLERLSTRIFLGRATPKDFVALKQSLASLPNVAKALTLPAPNMYATAEEANASTLPASLQPIVRHWDDLTDIQELLSKSLVDNPPPTITDGGLFKGGFCKELDEILDLVEHGEQKLAALLAEEQEKNNLPKLKLGYNRVFGYYLELTKSATANIPEHFIRRQTIANGERFITPALKELENKILEAGDKRKAIEYQLFQELRNNINVNRQRILFMAGLLAALDYFQGLAEVAKKKKWTRPTLHTGLEISIKQGRHPVVEALCDSSGFVANDLHMDEKKRFLLITGPNMAGKSTVLRQSAIILLLAQIGSFVPAKEAYLGLTDRIFSRVGASDNLAQGQSTFMVEMMETARILRQATKRSFVILDEIGRGTSTFDGLALAWAVLEDLLKRSQNSVRTLFATHYHELTMLEGRLDGLHNMNIAIREWNGDIVFLRRLVPGPSDRSYGIEVAKLAGIPAGVVSRAKQILHVLEQSRTDKTFSANKASIQELLPGLDNPSAKETKPILPELTQEVAHPLVTSLQSLDTNNLTPLQALSILNEWKMLWGEHKNN